MRKAECQASYPPAKEHRNSTEFPAQNATTKCTLSWANKGRFFCANAQGASLVYVH